MKTENSGTTENRLIWAERPECTEGREVGSREPGSRYIVSDALGDLVQAAQTKQHQVREVVISRSGALRLPFGLD